MERRHYTWESQSGDSSWAHEVVSWDPLASKAGTTHKAQPIRTEDKLQQHILVGNRGSRKEPKANQVPTAKTWKSKVPQSTSDTLEELRQPEFLSFLPRVSLVSPLRSRRTDGFVKLRNEGKKGVKSKGTLLIDDRLNSAELRSWQQARPGKSKRGQN